MTQEYTPDTDDAINLIAAGMGVVNQLGIAPVGYPSTETEAEESAKRWLAAHDREVAAKALKLTDRELAVMEAAYDQSIEEWEGDGLGAMSVGLKAVAKYRQEQQQ